MKEEKEDNYMKCPLCGGHLNWSADFNAVDVYPDPYEYDEEAVASYYDCDTCGRSYEICDPPKDIREKLKYWQDDA